MPKDLLFEIGTEEIPAGFIPGALKSMEELAAKSLEAARLSHGKMRAMGNPRRLALHVAGLAERQPDSVRVALGPPKKAAFDESGRPTKAAEGFAKSQGVAVEQLTIKAAPYSFGAILVRSVTNSSAAVGWTPIVASNCALVAPQFIAAETGRSVGDPHCERLPFALMLDCNPGGESQRACLVLRTPSPARC